MKVLITGGAGFIGQALVQALPPHVEVVVVDALIEDTHGSSATFGAGIASRARCIHCDVRHVEAWRVDAEGADAIVHLAALTGTAQSMDQPDRYAAHNVEGTIALCEAIAGLRSKPRRVIVGSSRAVYGEGAYLAGTRIVFPGRRDEGALATGRWHVESVQAAQLQPVGTPEDAPLKPVSVYGATKLEQENLVRDCAVRCGIDCLLLRFQNVYGPLQSLHNPYTGILGAFLSSLVHRGEVELFEDGGMTRDFVFVDDAVRAIVEGAMYPAPLGLALNVGSGQPVPLRDVVGLLGELTGRQPAVTCRGRYRAGDVRHAAADMRRYESLFGPWNPVPLRVGIADYVRWFLEQPRTRSRDLVASLDAMREVMPRGAECP